MKHLSRILILLFIVLLGTTSCGSDEPEGKWAKMKWTNVDNLMNVNGNYLLPEGGGTFTFLCRNYDHPWFSSVSVDGVQIQLDNETTINGEWFSMKFDGNKLIIIVESLPASVEARNIQLTVTAGDIFDYFTFIQERGVQ